MKTSSESQNRPFKRSEAVAFALINQLATPGLGSWLGRRKAAGVGQLALALAGFGLVLCWFFGRLLAGLREAGVEVKAPQVLLVHANSLGKAGGVLFAAAWGWSLFTSVSMVRTAAPGGRPPPLKKT